MRNVLKILSLICLLICGVVSLYSQNISKEASGYVYDENGDPMIGVSIRLLSTKKATVTDINGYFSLKNIDKEKYQLQFSFIGYKNHIISLSKSNKKIRITMKEDSQTLKEVVVRSNINSLDIREKSGVVSKVAISSLKEKPMGNIAMALQGMATGLQVNPGTDIASKPTIRIRGNSSLRKGDAPNEPLYVLDGKIITAEAFMLLNPQDIKEMKILKDAAALAIYGVKAANGVIEISSRRGQKGKATISFSSEMGITFKGRRTLKMMDTKEKLDYERRAKASRAPGYILSEDFISLYRNRSQLDDIRRLYSNLYGAEIDNSWNGVSSFAKNKLDSLSQINTDWFDTLLRNTFYQTYYLNLRGGTDNISYYTSVSYSDQNGQLPGNRYRKLQGMMSLDWDVNDWTNISLSASSAWGNSSSPNDTQHSLDDMLYTLNSYESPDSEVLYSYPRRKYSDLFKQYIRRSNSLSNSISASFDIRPLEGLQISGVGGIDILRNNGISITPSSNFDEINNGYAPDAKGFITKSISQSINISNNIRATYNKVFADKHDLTLSANFDYYYDNNEDLSATGYGTGKLDFISSANMSLEGSRKPYFSAPKYSSAQLGYGASIGYSYDNTYDLFSTVKMDASSILPNDKKWNSSWAVGAGIHFSEMPFIKNDILSDLSLRSSYGYIANISGVQKNETVAIFNYNNEYYNSSRAIEMLSIYNPNLRPEKTLSLDLGLSLGFVNRYSVSLQFYRRLISDALLDVGIASSTGFATEKRNIGELMNRGFEFSSSFILWQGTNSSFSIRGDISYNDNKVLDLYDKDAIYTGDNIIADYIKGEPYNLQWGWKNLGINPLTGIPMLEDKNGKEHEISKDFKKEDLKVLGYSVAPFNGSLGISYSYGDFDFDCSFYYTLGAVKPYSFQYVRSSDDAHKNAPAGLTELTWFESGDEGKIYPSPSSSTSIYNNFRLYPNSRMLASASYIKLSHLSLSYRIPTDWLRKSTNNYISYASISLRASNLFTFTPYNSGSPEAATSNIPTQPILVFATNITF